MNLGVSRGVNSVTCTYIGVPPPFYSLSSVNPENHVTAQPLAPFGPSSVASSASSAVLLADLLPHERDFIALANQKHAPSTAVAACLCGGDLYVKLWSVTDGEFWLVPDSANRQTVANVTQGARFYTESEILKEGSP